MWKSSLCWYWRTSHIVHANEPDESSVILRALCVSVVFLTTEPRRAQSDTEASLKYWTLSIEYWIFSCPNRMLWVHAYTQRLFVRLIENGNTNGLRVGKANSSLFKQAAAYARSFARTGSCQQLKSNCLRGTPGKILPFMARGLPYYFYRNRKRFAGKTPGGLCWSAMNLCFQDG
jgi:hypothetical protein